MRSSFGLARVGRRRFLGVILTLLVALTGALPPGSAGLAAPTRTVSVVTTHSPAAALSTNKRKKLKQCRFTKRKRTWTLKRSCTLTKPLALPANTTLDGKNKTIKLAASAGAADPGIIQISGGSGTIRNLVLDGAALGDVPPINAGDLPPIIGIYGSQSTLRNVKIRRADYRAIEIHLFGPNTLAVTLDRVTGIGGLSVEADRFDTTKTVSITNASILGTAMVNGIIWRGPSGTITDTVISGRSAGIALALQSTVAMQGITVTGARIGIEVSDGSVLHLSNSTLTGRGAEDSTENSIRGVMFGPNSAGSVTDTTITDYNGVGHDGQDGCGIAILPSASGDIEHSGNTLTNNKVEVCDPPE